MAKRPLRSCHLPDHPLHPPIPPTPPHAVPLFFFLPGRKLHQPWSSCPSCLIVSRGGGPEAVGGGLGLGPLQLKSGRKQLTRENASSLPPEGLLLKGLGNLVRLGNSPQFGVRESQIPTLLLPLTLCDLGKARQFPLAPFQLPPPLYEVEINIASLSGCCGER